MIERNKIYIGNNMDVLATFPDNSVDSIVTDPPYGLSNQNGTKRIFNVFQRSFDVMFPNFDQLDSKILKYNDLVRISLQSSNLSGGKIFNVIKPFIGVPKSSINLNGDVLNGDVKVDTSGISSGYGTSNVILGDKNNIKRTKYIGNYILDFGNAFDLSVSNLGGSNIGEYGFGFFTMPISSIVASFLPNDCRDFFSDLFGNGVDNIIRPFDDSFCQATASSLILASSGAKNRLMLRFDLANTSNELNATISATDDNRITQFISPKLVRTSAATSSLSSKLEPCSVRFIVESADGTDSIYFLHLYIPRDLFPLLHKTFERASGFMGKKWDYDVPSVELWKEALRVLKPGGHILVACGTRTQHRMACNIEDGGFEIRDIVAWVYGSGFPKSMDVEKAIESYIKNGKSNPITLKKTEHDGDGEEYQIIGKNNGIMGETKVFERKTFEATTTEAKQWQGFGTALKPAMELWTLARKPLDGTVAQNVLEWGCGALNIDGCRIGTEEREQWSGKGSNGAVYHDYKQDNAHFESVVGRFPANFIHDGSDEVVKLFPQTQSGKMSANHTRHTDGSPNGIYGKFNPSAPLSETFGDNGSAARFFYTAKANQDERNMGLDEFEEETVDDGRNKPIDNAFQRGKTQRRNIHPTVKPVDLMRYLVRLITPPNGVCLDPYLGSGTTAIACKLEGFDYIGIEREQEYAEIAKARVEACDRDYKTKSELIAGGAKEVFDIFDILEETE